MNELEKRRSQLHGRESTGCGGAFSLLEVVLAIGVFAIAVTALLGLLAPALRSSGDVQDANSAEALISRLNAFLRSRPQAFATAYSWVAEGRSRVLLAYHCTADPHLQDEDGRSIPKAGGTLFEPVIRVLDSSPAGDLAVLERELAYAVGAVFKVRIEGSSLNPMVADEAGRSVLPAQIENYREGFLALAISVYGYRGRQIDKLLSANGFDAERRLFSFYAALNR